MKTRRRHTGILAAILAGVLAFLGYTAFNPDPEPPPQQSQSRESVAATEEVTDLPPPVSAPAPATATPAPPEPAVEGPAILGAIVDEGGEPIAGAAVAAYHPDRGAARTTANDSGAFALGPLEALAYRLTASHEGYNETTLDDIETGETVHTLILTPASRATGWVEDGTGNPITTFDLVYLRESRGDATWWREAVNRTSTPWQSVAHPEGFFEVDNVASGEAFSLGARAPGFEPAFVVVQPTEPGREAPPARIQLKAEARILGQVLTPDRAPVPHATIHQWTDPGAPVLATCDAEGRFEMAGLGDAPLELTAAADAYLPVTVAIQPRRGKAVEMEIVLALGGTIEGTVRKGTTPAPGQSVVVSRRTPPQLRKEASTDSDGRYFVEGIGAGEVTILAKVASNHAELPPQRLEQRAWAEPGQTTVVDFAFPQATAALEGWVTAKGAPLPLAELRGTVYLGESQATFAGNTGDDGAFLIEGIPPGPAWLEVSSTGDGQPLKQNVELTLLANQTTRQDIDFDLDTAIKGRVVGLAAGDVGQVMALNGDASVDLSSAEGIHTLDALSSGACDIGEDGAFQIEGLQPGVYTLVALVFAGASDTAEDVIHSTRIGTQKANLDQPGKLSITITLAPNEP